MIKKINHIAEKFPIFQKYDKNCQRSKNEARFQLSDPKWPSYLGRKKIVDAKWSVVNYWRRKLKI